MCAVGERSGAGRERVCALARSRARGAAHLDRRAERRLALNGEEVAERHAALAEESLLREFVLDDAQRRGRGVHLDARGRGRRLERVDVDVLDLDRQHVARRGERGEARRVRERARDARRHLTRGRRRAARLEARDAHAQRVRRECEHPTELTATDNAQPHARRRRRGCSHYVLRVAPAQIERRSLKGDASESWSSSPNFAFPS